jgi:hypothetical protein
VIADQQWRTVQEEDQQNQELLQISKQILQLTQEMHALSERECAAGAPSAGEG